MSFRIIKDNKNIHLEITNKNEIINLSLFDYDGKYELLAHRFSHSICNFVKAEANKEDEIEILKDWFKLIHEKLSLNENNKIDYIPILKDDTIEDKL